MSKLIRLSTDNNKLYFDNKFQSDIKIKPFSQIGLLNCNFEKDQVAITITQEDFVIFSIKRGNDIIKLFSYPPFGDYNLTNSNELLNYITNDINSQLNCLNTGNTVNEKNLGSHFRIDTTSGNYTNISYNQSPINTFLNYEDEFPDDIYSSDINREVGEIYSVSNNNRAGTIRSVNFELLQPVDTDNLTSNINDGGCFMFSSQINSLSTSSEGCTIGLVSDINKDLSNLDNWEYAVDITNSNDPYTIRWDGTTDISAEVPIIDDLLIFRTNHINRSGKFQLLLFNDSHPTGLELNSFTSPTDDSLFPVIYFRPEASANYSNRVKLNEVKIAPFKSQSTNYNLLLTKNISPALPSVQANVAEYIGFQYDGSVDFTFTMSKKLATFFGYNSKEIILNNSPTFDITSNNTIQQYEVSEAYLVEMLNLPINSYDGSSRIEQRKNILYIFQNDRDSNQPGVKYQSPEVLYLEMGNANAINLRNVQCRILDSQYNEVSVQGISNLTFVIKD